MICPLAWTSLPDRASPRNWTADASTGTGTSVLPVRPDGSDLHLFHSTVLRQLAADLHHVAPLKTSRRKHCMGSKERDPARRILQVSQAASRPDIMGFIRHHTGDHHRLAKMHRIVIRLATNRLTDRHGRRSSRGRFDRSQTEEDQGPQASKAPAPNPRRRGWMRFGHFHRL